MSSSATDSAQRDGQLSAGETTSPEVPDFALIRPIGRGGFGQVWLATNRATGRLRAVKLIPLEHPGATDPAGREITSITRLEATIRTEHPHLLNIHHVGKTAEFLFYVMEPADDASGSSASTDPDYRPATLRSRMESGPLDPEQCLLYARQLLAGLASLHAAGMVHRDVKPENCLFVQDELKLADFGLLTESDPHMSRVGTHKYMPPDGRMDTRADVYAAGLVIYEMLAGLSADRFPRLGDRAREVIENPILNSLNRLVLRACQPDPEARFSDAAEMLAELTTPEPYDSARRARRRRQIAAFAACGIVAAVLALIPFGLNRLPLGGPRRVDVNFITEPYNATIHLNGALLTQSDGAPYLTPCTVEDLPAKVYDTVFKRPNFPDLPAGEIDFATTGEVLARWYGEP